MITTLVTIEGPLTRTLIPEGVPTLGRVSIIRFAGAARPHTPRLQSPPERGLTPNRIRHGKRTPYEYECSTRVINETESSQRKVDNTIMDGILWYQVASFSMHFWLKLR